MLFLQQKGAILEHFKELKASKIFCDISEADCQAMMYCFKTKFKFFKKHESIVKQGENIIDVPLIVKGAAIVENVDYLGNISVSMKLQAGDLYGVESAFVGDDVFQDSVVATEKTLVLFMNKHNLITPCQNKCKRHDLVIRGLMQIVAERNSELMTKITHMAKKSIRDKLLSYLSYISNKEQASYFTIPFNKTELANYLSVDRSAMSTELSKLREEGIIDFDKNEYHLLDKKKIK